MNIKSEELEKYLESSLTAIRRGLENSGGFKLVAPIEFDLAVVNTRESGGGLKVFVADAKGKFKAEQTSRIKIKVGAQIKKPRPSKKRR